MSEFGNRADFLATVRRAVTTPHAHGARPVAPLPSPLPAVAYASTPTDLVVSFATALTNLGGVVRQVSGVWERLAIVADALTLANPGPRPTRVVITDEPECAGLRELLGQRRDIELLAFDNPHTVASADLGITGARAGVALTGSLVVDSARAGGRTASLLPPVHLALVPRDAIVATPGDSWREFTAPMPSNVVQITGPSRSADIELIITLGVHGPRSLIVGVLSDIATRRESPQ